MTVIELGEIGAEPERSPAGAPWNPRTWRRWAAAGVVLLCALVLGASGRPGEPTVRQLWEIRSGSERQATVRDDGVFVHQRDGVGPPELTAYDVVTGAVRWRRQFGTVPTYMAQGAEAGLLMIATDEQYVSYELEDGSEGTRAFGGYTVALDAATGDQRWKVSGEVQTTTAGTVLLGERDRDGLLTSIRLVSSRDGTTRWKRDVPGAEQVTVPLDVADPDRIIVGGPTGRLVVFRYADGAVVGDRPVPWGRAGGAGWTHLTLANDLLLLVRQEPTASKIIAYRIDTLEEVWRRDSTAYAYPLDCGPVMCLSEADDSSGLDPATGRDRWRLPGYGNVYPVSGDRLLATATVQDRTEQVLVEPATGRQVGTNAPGWPMSADPGQDHLVLINRYYTQSQSTSSVDRLDLSTGRRVRIGVVTDLDAGRCSTARGHLVCEEADRLVAVSVG